MDGIPRRSLMFCSAAAAVATIAGFEEHFALASEAPAADASGFEGKSLSELSDEELLKLELLVLEEKRERHIDASPLEVGTYICGADIAAGSYTITAFAVKDEDRDGDAISDLCISDSQGSVLFYEFLYDNTPCRIKLDEGDTLEVSSYNAWCTYTIGVSKMIGL